MLNIKEIVKNVAQFSIGKYFLYKDKQKNIYCNNNQIYEGVDDDMTQYGDNLLFNFKNDLKIVNLLNNNINTIKNIAIINTSPSFIEKSILIDENNNLYFFDKRNLNKTNLLFKDYDWGFIYIYGNIIFISTEGGIISYSFNQFTSIWNFSLSQLKNNPYDDNYEKNAGWKIKKIIGVLENKLWIALNHHTIIALDIETGDLVYQIHDIPDFNCEWLPSAIPLSEATVVNEKIGKLIGFMWEFYWEIDPSNGVVQFWDLTDKLLPQEIRNDLSQYVLTDKYIYFASHFASKVGALNRKTKEIDWSYTFDKNENGLEPRIMNIQGNDSTLGALSSKGELYIFEKE